MWLGTTESTFDTIQFTKHPQKTAVFGDEGIFQKFSETFSA
jgi:hypothetical protein